MNHAHITDPHELVINWHITEACNYKCKYCYAKWQDTGLGKELIHDISASKMLLEEIYQFFSPNNLNNPLRSEMVWNSLRLNLAGGEPLLYAQKVVQITNIARQIGFEVSIITNGSLLTSELIKELSPNLTMLGISLDSTKDKSNLEIGRIDKQSRMLSINKLADVIALGKRLNSKLQLKINTVVNTVNWHEDMSSIIQNLSPDKWKVLRVMSVITDNLAVTNMEFNAFVKRHNKVNQVMRIEDNIDMTESYIMIDPHGRFFQNSLNHKGYEYSDSIITVTAARAFSQVNLLVDKFCSRYSADVEELQS